MINFKFDFNEPMISIFEATKDLKNGEKKQIADRSLYIWSKINQGESFKLITTNGSRWGEKKIDKNLPSPTLTQKRDALFHWSEPRMLTDLEIIRLQTFPDDYNFNGRRFMFTCGMSVPPFMMQRISNQIAIQAFNKNFDLKLNNGSWLLKDIEKVQKNNLNVFSCFSCGGGSTMGYKLAGYNVLGCVEIDKKMIETYKLNFNPKYSYCMPIQEFKNIPKNQIPIELFNLDILDGSPPCSVFSMAGKREKKWGKLNYFSEGQEKQILDDLFFDFLDVVDLLKPKVVIAENVPGLLKGNAKYYVKMILKRFEEIGYHVQLFLFDASKMGVPQKRERVFFIANNL